MFRGNKLHQNDTAARITIPGAMSDDVPTGTGAGLVTAASSLLQEVIT